MPFRKPGAEFEPVAQKAQHLGLGQGDALRRQLAVLVQGPDQP